MFPEQGIPGALTILAKELDAFKSDSVLFATTSPKDVAKAMTPVDQGCGGGG